MFGRHLALLVLETFKCCSERSQALFQFTRVLCQETQLIGELIYLAIQGHGIFFLPVSWHVAVPIRREESVLMERTCRLPGHLALLRPHRCEGYPLRHV